MATFTQDVSGVAFVTIPLSANLTNISLLNASDGQIITIQFQNKGSFTAASSSISGLASPPNGVSFQQFIYSATTGSWQSIGGSGASSSGSVPVTAGLIAQYALLDGTGTSIADSSGNGNSGTLAAGSQAPSWLPTGLSFAGASQQFVSLPKSLNSALSVMICAAYPITGAPGVDTRTPFLMSNNGGSGTTGGVYFGPENITGSTGPQEGPANNTVAMRIGSHQGGNFGTGTRQFINGPVTITWVLAEPFDLIYVNGNQPTAYLYRINPSAGEVLTGNYQLGGSATGDVAARFFSGQIYYALFYSTLLTAEQILQNTAFLNQQLVNRGVTPSPFSSINSLATDTVMLDGDSIPAGVNGTAPSTLLTLNDTNFVIGNNALGGSTSMIEVTDAPTTIDPALNPSGAKNVSLVWCGTNDGPSNPQQTISNLATYCRARRAVGWKTLICTMISRASGLDPWKNTLNGLIRPNWNQWADGLIDIAANPNLGADGAYTNTRYFNIDQTHPTSESDYNIIAFMMQQAINRLYGNRDFSSANIYATGAAAATTISAASQTGNIMTFTTVLNPPVGSMAIVAGMTPSTYNSSNSGSGAWLVLTTSATQFTAYNITTGIGIGTGFGTAAIPLQQDADVCIILGGSSSAQNFTLQSAIGYTGQSIQLKNTNSNAWTVTPFGSETINGASSISVAAGATLVLESVLISPSAAGANWISLSNS